MHAFCVRNVLRDFFGRSEPSSCALGPDIVLSGGLAPDVSPSIVSYVISEVGLRSSSRCLYSRLKKVTGSLHGSQLTRRASRGSYSLLIKAEYSPSHLKFLIVDASGRESISRGRPYPPPDDAIEDQEGCSK